MKKSITLLALAAVAVAFAVAACEKEEPTVTYTHDDGQLRLRGVVVVRDTVPPDSVNYINMVFVKAGTFQMGGFGDTLDTEVPEREWEWEFQTPSHNVVLSENFYISQTEITQAIFEEVMGYNPSVFKNPDHPVENLTFEEALTFCDTLSARTGKNFTLPTEAQWEYAARGGHLAPQPAKVGVLPVYPIYAGGNDIDSLAWYRENSDSTSHPVAKKKPNVLGLYDMSGNVSEWCLDYWGRYTNETQHDPTGPATGTNRVRRGGSWAYYDRYCRAPFRDYMNPAYRHSYVGFRIVRLP
ncbi:MAG: formylglycine-generating enzyme family protein [Bacteroidales bacterium]|nr:formylglycine-generating enzyme family protein [Bacteroidales bacterium]